MTRQSVSGGACAVRLEVDGRSVARTDVAAGEPVADVERRLAHAIEAWVHGGEPVDRTGRPIVEPHVLAAYRRGGRS